MFIGMNLSRDSIVHRKSWRTLVLLALVLVFAMSTWFSATAVIPQLTNNWDLNATTAAWMTIAVQLGFVIGAVLSSLFNLADLVPSEKIMMIGSLGAGLANFLILFANGPGAGIPLRFATGFFIAAVYPPAFKLTSTWFIKKRGQALGIMAAALVIGNGFPHLINALGGLEWEIVLEITSFQALIGGIIAGMCLQEGPNPFPSATADLRQIGRVLKNRGVRLATLGYVGHMWELFAMGAWILVFYVDVFDYFGVKFSSGAAYMVFAIFFAGGLGSWLGGILADRWGRMNTAILMLSISGSCALIIGLVSHLNLAAVLCIGLIWGASVVADSAQFSTMVTESADQSYVGTALTFQMASGFAITIVAIWLLPYLQDWLGWRWAFSLLALGPVFGILAMLRLKALPEAQNIGRGK